MFASEVKKMSVENMKPQEQLTLEPYERDHAVVVGTYRYTNINLLYMASLNMVFHNETILVHQHQPLSHDTSLMQL